MKLLFVKFFEWLLTWFKYVFGQRIEHKKYYFVAGEVVIQVQHPENATSQAILEAVRSLLTSAGESSKQNTIFSDQKSSDYEPPQEGNWKNKLQPPPDNVPVITFQNEGLGAFSLIPVKLARHDPEDLSPDSVISVLKEAYAELQAVPENGPLPMGDDTSINLLSISPNWFSCNLHHGSATGGPGSWPVSAPPPSLSQSAIHLDERVYGISSETSSQANKKVNIAILDTAPVSNQNEMKIRTMIPTLQPISYHNGSRNSPDLMSLRPYTPASEHIEVPDHGTFIASIIHSVTKDATIYLYEALNSYAVGSFTVVAQELLKVLNERDDRQTPLIINCSFMFRVPAGDDLVEDLGRLMPALTRSMRDVFESATRNRPNVTIMAAAGNDATPEIRPPACYPAAFMNVVGVGALPRQDYPQYPSGRFVPASYSNLSYSRVEGKLPNNGYMTFGGELDDTTTTNGVRRSSNGVLGIYLGPISSRNPRGVIVSSPNSTEWARWAGTSFATPILVGLLARDGVLPNPSPYLTAEGENVIQMQQG